jgi:hypothetical protein
MSERQQAKQAGKKSHPYQLPATRPTTWPCLFGLPSASTGSSIAADGPGKEAWLSSRTCRYVPVTAGDIASGSEGRAERRIRTRRPDIISAGLGAHIAPLCAAVAAEPQSKVGEAACSRDQDRPRAVRSRRSVITTGRTPGARDLDDLRDPELHAA